MVQKKKTGRPREFDREAALAAAVEVFWLEGYDGASLDDLTGAMGINRPSLYGSFGDKQALFLAALKYYCDGAGHLPIVAFEAQFDPKSAITQFFQTLIESETRTGGAATGCFIGSCAATAVRKVPGVEVILGAHAARMSDALTKGFERFKQEKLLPSNFQTAVKVGLMVDIMLGIAFRSRMGADCQSLLDEVAEKVDQVLLV